ncbi:putative transcriptional regulator [Saccharicrinis carchari]|uniref:Putative transcriptional regulator n=1 Tax=Saccharicrinis carchari TaxID=1168039 RepID=A0A521CDN2_SACCC|nr:YqgE/AlgH family protein [Saccharicrinis carchari]SMO57544.1 putative transcriptional regulator [Saccharicrinis carchari]
MKKLDFNIFKASLPKMAPAKGRILIADPFLRGPYFGRSIILLTEYSEQGAVGFVLNKTNNLYPDELIEELLSFKGELHIGGPVAADTLYFIHTLGDKVPGSLQITDNVWWGGDFEQLKRMLNNRKATYEQVKFFAGYSGWSPKQLEREIEENSWVVTQIDDQMIMSNNMDNIWKESLESLGDVYKSWSGFPEDPSFN